MTTLIRRAYLNYDDQVQFFNKRLNQIVTDEELIKFYDNYYQRASHDSNIPTIKELKDKIKLMYEILSTIDESNYKQLVRDNTKGICYNLDVTINGFHDEDNHGVYDVIYALSKLFYHNDRQFDRFFVNPIPYKDLDSVYAWYDDALSFRLSYIKWLAHHMDKLVNMNVNDAMIELI